MLIFFWFMAAAGPPAPKWSEEVPVETRHTIESIPIDEAMQLVHNVMPGYWKPFAGTSPWNQAIGGSPPIHIDSTTIINRMIAALYGDPPTDPGQRRVRFSTTWNPPLWVVEAPTRLPQRFFTAVTGDGDGYHESVDANRDRISDAFVPITDDMWPESEADGHIIIFSKPDNRFWEASRFVWDYGMDQRIYGPRSTTFATYDNAGDGYGVQPSTAPLGWTSQGCRGSGAAAIGGLIRPEEIEYCLATSTDIEHALSFGFQYTRKPAGGGQIFQFPPCVRADGNVVDATLPIEGMLFQLDPTLTDSDFDTWNLNPAAKVIARCLQNYGMYLVDRAGSQDGWPLYIQLLSPDNTTTQDLWKARFPNIFNEIKKIRTTDDGTLTGTPTFRVINTGAATTYP